MCTGLEGGSLKPAKKLNFRAKKAAKWQKWEDAEFGHSQAQVCCSVLQCVAVFVRCIAAGQDSHASGRAISFFTRRLRSECAAVRGVSVLQYEVCVCCSTRCVCVSCATLQHSISHCNVLQHTCNILRRTATHCNTLQHTATHRWRGCECRWCKRRSLQHTTTNFNTL